MTSMRYDRETDSLTLSLGPERSETHELAVGDGIQLSRHRGRFQL
jgi:hypothetical protein